MTAIAVAVGVMMIVVAVVDVAGISLARTVGDAIFGKVDDIGADAVEQPDSHSVEIHRMEMTSSEPMSDSLGIVLNVCRAGVINVVCMVALP